MLRGEVIKGLDHDPNFRWRGEAVTRIENLSDIVFALALSMMISAASVPTNFDQLNSYLLGVIPAVAAFAVLLGIWHAHFTFFRRYGVADKHIIFLNAILLFVVLYVAYPLRFAFDSLFSYALAVSGAPSRAIDMGLDYDSSGDALALFGVGFMVIHFIYTLMLSHIIKKRDVISLNHSEMQMTRRSRFYHAGVALLSANVAVFAYFTVANGFAGLLLCFTGIVAAAARKKYKIEPEDEPKLES